MRKRGEEAETVAAPRAEPARELSAVEQLRKLEAELLGNTPNERGHGSTFQRLTPAQRAHFVAVEEWVKVEAELVAASAAAGEAAVKAEAAKKACAEAASKVKTNAAA